MKTAACQGSARKSSFFLACEGKDLGSRMSDLHAVKPGLVSQKKEYFLRSTLTRLGATGKVKVISTSGAKLHFQLKQNTHRSLSLFSLAGSGLSGRRRDRL